MDLLPKFKTESLNSLDISFGDKLLLALSGGPDSLTLFDLLLRVKEDYELTLGVFHLDHLLREESGEEAERVRLLCEGNEVEYWLKTSDIQKMKATASGSEEEVAREVRFAYMKEIYNRENFKAVLTGHQADDQVETMLFNLFRGAGMTGLRGMDFSTKKEGVLLYKPLLPFWREEIISYCKWRGLEPNIDKSNYALKYSRNRIREELIPYLQENFNPGLKETLYDTINIITDEDNFLNNLARNFYEDSLVFREEGRLDFDCGILAEVSIVMQRRIIRRAIEELKGSLVGIYQKHIEMITSALESEMNESETGKDYHLPGEIYCRFEYKILSFRAESWREEQLLSDYNIIAFKPGRYKLPGGSEILFEVYDLEDINWQKETGSNVVFFDFDKIAWPLKIRTRDEGDRFIPLNFNGTKKLKDFFIDAKSPVHIRNRIPILVDALGRIIWIAGMRMDDRFKITAKTKRLLLAKYIDN
ncbi:MAG: tRNA lysidine(34) synthetase TilS [Bacillota bacterium]